jgi:hypothetical protein
MQDEWKLPSAVCLGMYLRNYSNDDSQGEGKENI